MNENVPSENDMILLQECRRLAVRILYLCESANQYMKSEYFREEAMNELAHALLDAEKLNMCLYVWQDGGDPEFDVDGDLISYLAPEDVYLPEYLQKEKEQE